MGSVNAERNLSGLVSDHLVKRATDIFLLLLLMPLLFIPMSLVALCVRFTSSGKILYWSDRVGKDNKIFRMPKFRTMRADTPEVASHLLTSSHRYFTPIGSILRRTSLDELPQLYSILIGDLTFVGPRPALFNQDDLISLRTELGIQKLTPGLTGWAQVNGRDEISIQRKVELDKEYMDRMSVFFDLRILFFTFWRVITGVGVDH